MIVFSNSHIMKLCMLVICLGPNCSQITATVYVMNLYFSYSEFGRGTYTVFTLYRVFHKTFSKQMAVSLQLFNFNPVGNAQIRLKRYILRKIVNKHPNDFSNGTPCSNNPFSHFEVSGPKGHQSFKIQPLTRFEEVIENLLFLLLRKTHL